MADFESEYTINFTWHGDLNLPEVSSVEIILAPARSVWDDHFDEDYSNHTVSYGLHKMENGMFTADIPLRINIYHFLFRINNCAHDLAPSCKHNTTSLANGRKLNYINVGDPLNIIQLLYHPESEDQSKSALPRQGDERTPLLSSSSRPRVKGIKRFFLCCCLD